MGSLGGNQTGVSPSTPSDTSGVSSRPARRTRQSATPADAVELQINSGDIFLDAIIKARRQAYVPNPSDAQKAAVGAITERATPVSPRIQVGTALLVKGIFPGAPDQLAILACHHVIFYPGWDNQPPPSWQAEFRAAEDTREGRVGRSVHDPRHVPLDLADPRVIWSGCPPPDPGEGPDGAGTPVAGALDYALFPISEAAAPPGVVALELSRLFDILPEDNDSMLSFPGDEAVALMSTGKIVYHNGNSIDHAVVSEGGASGGLVVGYQGLPVGLNRAGPDSLGGDDCAQAVLFSAIIDDIARQSQVRKLPSWPRSWTNSSLYSCIPTGMHKPTCIFRPI